MNFFRSPFGAVQCNETITLRLKIETNFKPIDYVCLKFKNEAQQDQEVAMQLIEERGEEKIYQATIEAPATPCLLWYYFAIYSGGNAYFYGNRSGFGGMGKIYDDIPPSYQITVYKAGAETPVWFKEGVMYQIFVDRFFNGSEDGNVLDHPKNTLLHLNWDDDPIYLTNHKDKLNKIARWSFFGGNLLGVKKKLVYLKSLGISVIYFNPIFKSVSNHKYDTGDYHNIDPMFGDNELFEELCLEAKEMGISIILDGVFSHTGSDSIYFNKEGNYDSIGAYQSVESPYYKWFCFLNCNEYECWWQIDTLPNVNELDPSYQDFIIFSENSVLKYWLRKGAKGWRLDVVDELPDDFIKKFSKTMKEVDGDAVLIGEVWEDASNKMSYGKRREYLLGDEVDSVMNYPFRNAVMSFINGEKDAGETTSLLMGLNENYPPHVFYSTMNLIDSHDVPRAKTLIKDALPNHLACEDKEKIALERLKLVVLWQMTFPGVPCIYYGDEAGLEGREDPLNRGTYPWGRENQDLLTFYKKIVALRNHYDIFKTGHWIPLDVHSDIFAYIRSIDGGKDIFGQEKSENVGLVLLNRSFDQKIDLTVDVSQWFLESLVDVLDNNKQVNLQEGKINLSLQPLEGRLYIKDRWSSNLSDNRECGILLHPTSLPSKYGIGDLGKEAFSFIDFLAEAKQKLWQILPLNPPGYGNSPYQCYSAFAGNTLLIDLEDLLKTGLLEEQDLAVNILNIDKVDFEEVKSIKENLLLKAFKKFKNKPVNAEYQMFLQENTSWLEDYALFMALKAYFKGSSWNKWEVVISQRDESALIRYREMLGEEIDYIRFSQYIFFKQWKKLRAYANSKGIKIVGDIPIFVAHDSSDVWTKPEFFELDNFGNASKVAGVPPDYFSENGQRWGNPLYKWNEMEKSDFEWWRRRFQNLLKLVDVIRIDHFRGFEEYWEISAVENTAINGKWVKGPGEKFFSTMKKYLGNIPVIAEDLGILTPEVTELRLKFDFPGMKILHFEMEEGEFKLPLNEKHTVIYTGSHDNDTTLGWYKDKYKKTLAGVVKEEEIPWHFIEMAYKSDAETVIIPLQDVLALDSDSRMNTPGTLQGNWQWQYRKNSLITDLADKLARLVDNYRR